MVGKTVPRTVFRTASLPICQKPNASKPAKGHKTCRYLLAGLRIERPDQVWCSDITCSPMRRGLLCLVAIMDWFTRKVPAWRISDTPEVDFCLEALDGIRDLGRSIASVRPKS